MLHPALSSTSNRFDYLEGQPLLQPLRVTFEFVLWCLPAVVSGVQYAPCPCPSFPFAARLPNKAHPQPKTYDHGSANLNREVQFHDHGSAWSSHPSPFRRKSVRRCCLPVVDPFCTHKPVEYSAPLPCASKAAARVQVVDSCTLRKGSSPRDPPLPALPKQQQEGQELLRARGKNRQQTRA